MNQQTYATLGKSTCVNSSVHPKKKNTGDKSTFYAVTLWYDQCHMKCKLCLKTFDSSDAACEHDKNEKHGTGKLVGKVDYRCKICQSGILCRRDVICHHLTDEHGLTLEEYEESYENWEMKQKGNKTKITSTNDSRDKKKTSQVNQEDEPAATTKTTSTNTPELTVNGESKSWYDRCLYKCGSCSKTFLNADAAGAHSRHTNTKSTQPLLCPCTIA
jgi:hypothetical protein